MYHLRCVHPHGPYKRGDTVTEESEVARLIKSHEKYFVRVPAPATAEVAPTEIEVGGVEYEKVTGKRK